MPSNHITIVLGFTFDWLVESCGKSSSQWRNEEVQAEKIHFGHSIGQIVL